MEIKVFEKNVASSDGIHQLAGRVYVPEGGIRGIFHVVHGMIEHIGRYDSFMRIMAAHGFVCFGFDNLGHGHTAEAEGDLGFIAKKNGSKLLCDDVYRFGCEIKKMYGENLPYILLGHSMGSFIVRCTAYYYPSLCSKLIIMGTGGPNLSFMPGLILLNLVKKIKGERSYSAFCEKLITGSFNKRFDEKDGHAWLSTVPEIRTAFRNDKLCSFHFTVSAMYDLVKLYSDCNSEKFTAGIDKNLPIFIVSGADDPVGDFGHGVKKVYDNLKKSLHSNVTFKLYKDCRHEVLNDKCRKKLIREIISFSV